MSDQEQTQAPVLPQALIEESIEPNAVAVASDGQHIILKAFAGQVGPTQFVAGRVWHLGPDEALRLGQDIVKAAQAVKGSARLHVVGADQVPADIRG